MLRRRAVPIAIAAVVLSAGAAWLANGCRRAPPRVPAQHVLLIVVDTLRADHVSCYGYRRPTTPAIDALAKEGVRFEHAVAQSSWTSPSMVSMMTSRYVAEETLAIPDDRPTLAERFRAAGWRTGAFITNDLLSRANKFDRGFEEFQWQLVPYGANDPIVNWLAQTKDQKTLTFLHLAEPHDEGPPDSAYRPQPPAKWRRWQDAPDNVPPDLAAWYDRTEKELGLADGEASRKWISEQRGAYDDDVACLDARIAEILDAVRANGLWEKTAIVVASDHGEGLWEYVQFPIGTRAKAAKEGKPATLANTLHQTHGSHVARQLVEVPLILKAPGLEPAVVASWVENVDVAPTLLEIAGIPPIPDAHGRSLLALAADPDEEDGLVRGAFTHTRYNSSLITQDGLQIVLPTERGTCEFASSVDVFDTERDPFSRANRAAGHLGVVGELESLARKRLESGIVASHAAIDPGTLKQLAGMGYLDAGVVDVVREKYRAMSTEELVVEIGRETDCLLRLEAVRALQDRDLAPAQKAELEKIRDRDGSSAVRRTLDAFLRRS